jgi:hypothetical protein
MGGAPAMRRPVRENDGVCGRLNFYSSDNPRDPALP